MSMLQIDTTLILPDKAVKSLLGSHALLHRGTSRLYCIRKYDICQRIEMNE